MSILKADTLKTELSNRARDLGFDTCRITDARLSAENAANLETFVRKNRHGSMQWMEKTMERRKSPEAMWSEAKTAILLGMNYGPDEDPLEMIGHGERAVISTYARNRDYHGLIKGKLKTLAGWLASKTGENVKVFVDTAPLMEKPLAKKAGLGWQGKHTNLVSREFGSWLFLGSILTTADLALDAPEDDRCGSCRSCLDVCPTGAFPAPYQIDARKCISYLTIEHAGPIPIEYRAAMGNRIYGCDDCLAVCPWNKYAKFTREAKLKARDDLQAPYLKKL
ncbi:MAG: tRNA epoxyqueuosine(34) reductase QueG, partial [Pseudomonadota bacterium]